VVKYSCALRAFFSAPKGFPVSIMIFDIENNARAAVIFKTPVFSDKASAL
jgi:hypothetical protein